MVETNRIEFKLKLTDELDLDVCRMACLKKISSMG